MLDKVLPATSHSVVVRMYFILLNMKTSALILLKVLRRVSDLVLFSSCTFSTLQFCESHYLECSEDGLFLLFVVLFGFLVSFFLN